MRKQNFEKYLAHRVIQALLLHGFIFAVSTASAFARLEFTQIKGMKEHIQLRPEYDYLDPISAFNFQRQSFLVNLVNYSPADESGEKDLVASWIKSVFVAPQHTDSPTFFQVSPLAKNFGRFLGPTTIGEILNKLALPDSERERAKAHSEPPHKLMAELAQLIEANSEFNENLKVAKELADQFQKQIDELELPDQKKKEQELIAGRDAKKQEQKKECLESANTSHCVSLALEIKTMNQELSAFQKESKKLLAGIHETSEYKALRLKRDQFRYEKKYLDSFLKKILNAWLVESDEKFLTKKGYPSHPVERTLMALAWMNTRDSDKAQFIALYEKIPHFLKDNSLLINSKNNSWVGNSFGGKDYDDKVDVLLKMSLKERAQYLINNPEEAAFLSHAYSFFDADTLPELGYKTVKYKSKSQGEVQFADCMDSSILNFFAITLKNRKSAAFDPESSLKKLEHEGFKANPEFLEFAKSHASLNSLDTTQAHEKWVPLVSDLKGIKYVQKNSYEMDTQISNVFEIMDHLLFNSEKGSLLKTLKSNQEKMDRLVALLSPEGHELEWSLKGGAKQDLNKKDTDVTLQFQLDEQPYFSWKISSGHAEIHTQSEGSQHRDWRRGVANQMLSIFAEEKRIKGDLEVPRADKMLRIQTLLGVLEKYDLDLVMQSLGHKRGLIESFNLDSNELKLWVILGSLKNPITSTFPYLKRVAQSLPLDDLHTQQLLSDAQANADYPWGDPSHALGSPEIKYVGLSSDPSRMQRLFAQHQGEVFKRAFAKAWIDPRGIIWSDVIIDGNGSARSLLQSEALALCEDIGAHLPTKEEWEALGKDMGYLRNNKSRYIPQFLPNLYGKKFWSSSGSSRFRGVPYVFHGDRGHLAPGNLSGRLPVRCTSSG